MPSNRLDPVPAALFHPGADGKHERVEQQVLRRQPVAVDRQVVDRRGRPQLPVGGPGLTFGVDTGAHHGGPVLPGQGQEEVQAGAGGIAVLQVDRVQDGLARDQLQPGLDDRRLGRVEHDRHGRLSGESAGDFLHVGHAVFPGVIHTNVEYVGAALDRLPGHGDAGVPVIGEHGFPELLGAVGVGPFANHEEGRSLVVGHVAVDRGDAGLPIGGPRGRGQVPAALDHGLQVLRGRSAASADYADSVLGDETGVVFGEVVRREVVVHPSLYDRRKAGVGQDRDGHPGPLRQVTEVLAHLDRAGSAVESHHVGAQGVKGGQGRPDLRAHQHATSRFDGHLNLDRHVAGRPLTWPAGSR